MFIKTLNKDVEIKKINRGMQRQITEKLMEGVITEASAGQADKTKFPAINIDRAEDFTVMLCTGLTQAEMDQLDPEEYDA